MKTSSLMAALFILTVTFKATSAALPFECLVVSGIKKDTAFKAFRAMSDILTTGTGLKDSLECRVFDSWDELMDFANSYKKRHQILILQGAHGQRGGSIESNGAYTSAEAIIANINKLSEFHQVGAVLQSCYSADLLAKKLAEDEQKFRSNKNQLPPKLLTQLENQCIYAASMPNFPAYGGQGKDTKDPEEMLTLFISRSVQGKNFEELYAAQLQGLLSSGEFSRSGISELYRSQDPLGMRSLGPSLLPYLKAENVVDDFKRGIAEDAEIYRTSRLALEGKLSEPQTYEIYDLIATQRELIHHYYPALSDLLKMKVFETSVCEKENFSRKECSSVKACLSSWVQHLSDSKISLGREENTVRNIYEELRKFNQQKLVCALPTTRTKDFWDDSLSEGFVNLYVLVDDRPDNKSYEIYKKKLRRLSSRVPGSIEIQSIHDYFNYLSNQNVQENPNTLIYKAIPPATPLGDGFPFHTTTQVILSSFMNSSLKKQQFTHPLDISRRKGCRNFNLPSLLK